MLQQGMQQFHRRLAQQVDPGLHEPCRIRPGDRPLPSRHSDFDEPVVPGRETQVALDLDIDAAEKCSPKAYIPGRKREPGDCKTENYVIKALCQ